MTIAQGIRKERAMLSALREIANMVIDTTNLRPIELRRTIAHAFERRVGPKTGSARGRLLPSASSTVPPPFCHLS